MATKAPVKGTLDDYQSSKRGKELMVSRSKVGKTITMLGSALGAFPWQQYGGIVDDPAHCHVMTFDAAALAGAKDFLVKRCGASKEIGKVTVYNLQRAAEDAFSVASEYSPTFPAAVYAELNRVKQNASKGGVHVLIISSLTMLAKAWLRSISGPAFTHGGKSSMDRNKWGSLKNQLGEFQWQAQCGDLYHTLWEAHHGEKMVKDEGTGQSTDMDTLQVDGATAQAFPANVERIWEIKRTASPAKDEKGKFYDRSLHEVWFDPNPKFNFGNIQTGRGVSGVLDDKVFDLTLAFDQLGLDVGGWGA